MKFSICNLGCKVNAYEAEAIASLLENRGWQRVNFEEEADACMIFTCAVTNIAAQKSRKMIFLRSGWLALSRMTGINCITAIQIIRKEDS